MILGYFILGCFSGIFSGLIGIGGGILIVPSLVYFFGLSQYQAQGTTLALMVPPVGILGAWAYYTKGYVDLKIAIWVALGFFVGSFMGSNFSLNLDEKILSRLFGILLILIGGHLLYQNR